MHMTHTANHYRHIYVCVCCLGVTVGGCGADDGRPCTESPEARLLRLVGGGRW